MPGNGAAGTRGHSRRAAAALLAAALLAPALPALSAAATACAGRVVSDALHIAGRPPAHDATAGIRG